MGEAQNSDKQAHTHSMPRLQSDTRCPVDDLIPQAWGRPTPQHADHTYLASRRRDSRILKAVHIATSYIRWNMFFQSFNDHASGRACHAHGKPAIVGVDSLLEHP